MNVYLLNKKSRNVQVKWKSYVVGEKVVNKEKVYEILDRFLVIER